MKLLNTVANFLFGSWYRAEIDAHNVQEFENIIRDWEGTDLERGLTTLQDSEWEDDMEGTEVAEERAEQIRIANSPPSRSAIPGCHWTFRSPECAYNGNENWCDQKWATCVNLRNTIHFGGFSPPGSPSPSISVSSRVTTSQQSTVSVAPTGGIAGRLQLEEYTIKELIEMTEDEIKRALNGGEFEFSKDKMKAVVVKPKEESTKRPKRKLDI